MSSNKFDFHIQKYSSLLNELLEKELLSFGSDNFQALLPQQKSGVYCVSERTGNAVEVIYIGKSKDLRNRIYKNHLIGSRRFSTLKRKIIQSEGFSNDADVENYLRERCAVQFVIIEDELERNFFEHFAIAIFRPKFND